MSQRGVGENRRGNTAGRGRRCGAPPGARTDRVSPVPACIGWSSVPSTESKNGADVRELAPDTHVRASKSRNAARSSASVVLDMARSPHAIDSARYVPAPPPASAHDRGQRGDLERSGDIDSHPIEELTERLPASVLVAIIKAALECGRREVPFTESLLLRAMTRGSVFAARGDVQRDT